VIISLLGDQGAYDPRCHPFRPSPDCFGCWAWRDLALAPAPRLQRSGRPCKAIAFGASNLLSLKANRLGRRNASRKDER